ncbi:MAG TPA: hypothetical protein VKV74_01335 [Bryobacteraceae bacterium]|nr:hypothetical protein [Bryobacteraceae bacterium]
MVPAPADAVRQFKEATLRKVADLRCPRHRQPPCVKFRGSALSNISIQMSACCNQLIEMANRAIAGRLP